MAGGKCGREEVTLAWEGGGDSSIRLKAERWSGKLAWRGAMEVIIVCRGNIIMCGGKWREF